MRIRRRTPWAAALLLLLGGCGAASSHGTTVEPVAAAAPREDRTIEELVAEVPFAKEWADLTDLTRNGRESVLVAARKANPDERVRDAYLMNVFHSSKLQVRVRFEAYGVEDRVRRYHAVFVQPKALPPSESTPDRRYRWEVSGEPGAVCESLELCVPWRSFGSGAPPHETEITDLWDVPDLDGATLLALVDCVRPLVPAGERIRRIEEDPELLEEMDARAGRVRDARAVVYEVWTVRGSSGRILEAEDVEGRWSAEVVGTWIS